MYTFVAYKRDSLSYTAFQIKDLNFRDANFKVLELIKENNVEFDNIEHVPNSFLDNVEWN